MSTTIKAQTGHASTGGLQTHSIGPSYPFAVVGLFKGWRALNLVTDWKGPDRLQYGEAQADIVIRQLAEKMHATIHARDSFAYAYAAGVNAYNSRSIHGNPYSVSSPEYGAFGSGYHDARCLFAAREAQDQIPAFSAQDAYAEACEYVAEE